MTTRKTCRVCGSKLKKVLSLGNLYISNFVENPHKQYPRAPLELVLCLNKDCELLQLKHTYNMNKLYVEHYWYKSGLNPVIVNDLKSIVKSVKKKKGVWVDVGANDGTLLSFVSKNFKRIGVEPASNFQKELKKHATPIPLFWESVKVDQKADVITAIGMFYDSEDPNKFIKNVTDNLADGGVFIAQLMTLKQMIGNNDIGNICHEHLEYYSYKSLVYLYERNGLEIYKVEENGINGGSYRLFARQYKKGSVKHRESKVNYEKFAKNILENKKKTVGFIKKVSERGACVCIYGASTKGNTIAQYYKLGDYIPYAIDKNKEKMGRYMIGTGILIVGEEWLDAADYALVMPYGFVEQFKKLEKPWLDDGGKFLLPFPKFKVCQ